MEVSTGDIERIVRQVLSNLDKAGQTSVKSAGAFASLPGGGETSISIGEGIFETIEIAVREATVAQRKLHALPLETRKAIISTIRARAREAAGDFGRLSVQETGLGRVEDKIAKIRLAIDKTPGVEVLEPLAYTGDDGLTLVERSPFGVIGATTPSTNPTETIINNGISMLAGGNSVVINPHPGAKNVSKRAISLINRAVVEAGGPPNCVTCVAEPTIETSAELMRHPGIRILVVTGGGGVVKAAMSSGKKTIAAGPGNPPVVVDETADIQRAAKYIVGGASFDNNVLCTAEKEIIVVDKVADELIRFMKTFGAYQVIGGNIQRLERLLLPDGVLARKYVGKDIQVILGDMGIHVGPEVKMAFIDVRDDHPFVYKEMLMPVLPLVRVPDVDSAIALAVKAEQGNLHSAYMHSLNIENLHKMARAVQATIFVKNGPSYAGLGFGGEGCTTFTIAGPTGEGITTARTFTRERRCVLKDYFRIV